MGDKLLQIHRGSGVHYLAKKMTSDADKKLRPCGWRRVTRGVHCSVRWQGHDETLVVLRIDTWELEPADERAVGKIVNEKKDGLVFIISADCLRKALRKRRPFSGDVGFTWIVPFKKQVVPIDLVVDFGNTNSVVAEVHQEDMLSYSDALKLSDRFFPEFDTDLNRVGQLCLPSCALIYRHSTGNIGRQNPEVVVGDTARSLALAMGADDHTFLESPKRRLHSSANFDFFDVMGNRIDVPVWQEPGLGRLEHWQEYHAAVFYLRELILCALEALNLPSENCESFREIKRVHFTVPVSFSRLEYNHILECARLALKLADINATADIICDESTAVAYYFLVEKLREQQGQDVAARFGRLLQQFHPIKNGRPELRIMVFDVGGGTSDISIADYVWSGEQTRITRLNDELVHADGMIFGGDDLTFILIKQLQISIHEKINEMSPDAGVEMDRLYLDANLKGLKRAISEALRYTFIRLADEVKRVASKEDDSKKIRIRLDDAFLDVVSEKNGSMLIDDPFSRLDAAPGFCRGRFYGNDGPLDLELDVNHVLGILTADRDFTVLMEHIVRLANEYHPQVLVLSGMTARLPIVGNVLKERLCGVVRVENLADLQQRRNSAEKAAVSLGAARIIESREVLLGKQVEWAPFPRYFRCSTWPSFLIKPGASTFEKFYPPSPEESPSMQVSCSFTDWDESPSIPYGVITLAGDCSERISIKARIRPDDPGSLEVESGSPVETAREATESAENSPEPVETVIDKCYTVQLSSHPDRNKWKLRGRIPE